MPWTDYTWQAGAYGEALVDLDDYCTAIRIVGDGGSGGKRGGNIPVPWLHGARAVGHKFAAESTVGLEVVLRYTNAAGAITHTDGAAGHAFENLAALKRIFYGRQGLSTLRRIAPDHGTVDLECEVLQPVMISQARHVFLFPLNCPKPYWRAAEQSSNPAVSCIVGGDAEIDDAEVVFASGTGPILTHTDSGATIQIEGAVPGGGVRVYVGEGRAARVTGGADHSAYVKVNKPYWLVLDAARNNSFTLSTGSATIYWRDRWRV